MACMHPIYISVAILYHSIAISMIVLTCKEIRMACMHPIYISVAILYHSIAISMIVLTLFNYNPTTVSFNSYIDDSINLVQL